MEKESNAFLMCYMHMKYAYELVLLPKEEAVLRGVIVRLNANRKVLWCGNKFGKN
jgi:hypothetical protein